MRRQNVQHSLAVGDAATGKNSVTEYDLFTVIVQTGTAEKQSLLVRLLNRPSGKATRDLLNVILRVAAVHTQRMQLHQLPRVVFVESAVNSGGFAFGCRIGPRHARPPVVEI